MSFYTLADMSAVQAGAGIQRRAVQLDHLMLTFFDLDSGAIIPPHQHPHEQISYVVRGALRFTLDGETRVLRAGEGATVPSNTPHEALALEDTVVIDGWSPVREDYRQPPSP
jgi:quercetin dioxygenase-like cupin family protein